MTKTKIKWTALSVLMVLLPSVLLKWLSVMACLDVFASELVAVGCIGELRLVFIKAPLGEEPLRICEQSKHIQERVFVCMVAIGVTIELILLPLSLADAASFEAKAREALNAAARANERAAANELHAAQLEAANLSVRSNLAELNNKALQLAAQYSMSTNALAEANARLAAIRPLKTRLVAWVNAIDPQILVDLRNGKTKCHFNVADFKLSELDSMLREPGIAQFVASNPTLGDTLMLMPGGPTHTLDIELKPALAQ